MVAREGFEPSIQPWKGCVLNQFHQRVMELLLRVELRQMELQSIAFTFLLKEHGGVNGIWTHNHLVPNQAFYQIELLPYFGWG